MSNTNFKVAIKIFSTGFLKNIVTNILAIFSRTVFIMYLGKELLGLNGAVTSILNILSLTELGVGTSFIYILYEALNKNDEKQISSIMYNFKKIYNIIGIIIFFIGISIIPFLDNFISAPDKIHNYILPCYIMFLIQTCISYFFSAYKRNLLIADKKENIVNKVLIFYIIFNNSLQIILITIFHSYIIYLIVGLISIILQNILISKEADKYYPYLKNNEKFRLPVHMKSKLKESISSIFIIKLGQAFYKTSDNIIISKFLGVSKLAIFDNYNLILNSLQQVLSILVTSFTSIIGNCAYSESKKELYNKFKKLDFVTFTLFLIVSISFFNCINPFIEWWLDDTFLLSKVTSLVISLRFFVLGLNLTLVVFKDALGLFKKGRMLSLVAGIVNVILSIVLLNKIGIVGIVFASLLCDLFIYYILHPQIVLKLGLKVNIAEYYKRYFLYWICFFISCLLTWLLTNFIQLDGLLKFIVNGVISVIISSLIILIIFRKEDEFKVLSNYITRNKH